jgi:hypothetical protein
MSYLLVLSKDASFVFKLKQGELYGNPINRALSDICPGRWRLGLFPLAPVASMGESRLDDWWQVRSKEPACH